MKKSFKIYCIIWSLCLFLFHLIVFIIPFTTISDASFWIGYSFITIAFCGQLACTYYVMNMETRKMFYGISLLVVSYVGLAAMLIVGIITMVIPAFPNWLGIILCMSVFIFMIISVVLAGATGSALSDVDREIKLASFTIRSLTADADQLFKGSKTNMIRKETKKVYEAIRYSDPITHVTLVELNERIQRQFAAFEDAVNSEDSELASAIAAELLSLLSERNIKCRSLK